ncbi:MAG: substrate-binding domain-containing protein [Victivallaceae bacterium]|jgi:GntR family transcriptional regulator of arabinose operon|nr:substrate-binding domain-containing protein [Victivallaceae bacterium]NLK83666.1 substrate-binding domain-containing protein [Lentisphaerota bacterium]MDD3116558.1 substrate-binding domain-containing protein [Victivallaceae bacterium]MDD3702663.1 substrate-binding domain-containing protein [Victivallaceae bacterium]MDD4318115.1 substrate-binding domain-containing protein [Victivallaceae bacterium]
MSIEYKKDIIYEHLKREILEQQLPPGSRLPKEKELAKALGVGQITLRSALARLETEKLVERFPGKGTFVTDELKRQTVLVVLPDGAENLETPSRYVAAGIDEAAKNMGVTLERCPAGLLNSFDANECQNMVRQHRITGILLETGHSKINENLVTKLKQLNLPVVIPHGLPTDAENTGFCVLRTDERAAWGDGLRYLAKAGHRVIASLFLELPSEQLTTFRGFTRQELREFYHYNGLVWDESLLQMISLQTEIVTATVRQWMLGPLPPTAIMCHSDRLAMRVYQVLKELRINIPQQVSIMGYSNYPGGQLLLPPLTTVDVKFAECGRMALEHLLRAEEWYNPTVLPREIITPYIIIERDSVAKLTKS